MSRRWMLAVLLLACMAWAVMPAAAEGRLPAQEETVPELPDGYDWADEFELPDGYEWADEFDLPDGFEWADEFELPDGFEWADEFELPDGFSWADEFTMPDGGQQQPVEPETVMGYLTTLEIPWGAAFEGLRVPLPSEYFLHPVTPLEG